MKVSRKFMKYSFFIYLSFSAIPLFGKDKQPKGDLSLNYADHQKAIAAAIKSNKKSEKIRAFTDMGKYYFELKKYEKSLNFLLKAKNLNPEDSVHITPYYTTFGLLFSEIGAYNAAIDYQKKIYQTTNNDLAKFYSVSSIAYLYLNLNKPDSAFHYYKIQHEEVALKMNDFMAESSSLNNIGLALMQSKKYEEAYTTFDKALRVYMHNKHTRSKYFNGEISVFYYDLIENIGRCHYYLKNYNEAIRCLEISNSNIRINEINDNKNILIQSYLKAGLKNKALSLLQFINAKGNKQNLNTLKKLHEINRDYYLFTSDFHKLKIELAELMKLEKLLETERYSHNNQMSLMVTTYLMNEAKANLKREQEKEKLILEELALEKKQKNATIIIGVIFVILTSLGVYVYYQFSKNKKRALELEKERLKFNNQLQEYKIQTQKAHITEFALDFNKNKEFDQNLIQTLNEIVKLDQNKVTSELKSLLAELKQKQLIDKKATSLVNESETILINFKNKLLKKHPSLNKNDLQLCYFLRLNLSNKEIATLKNVTLDSVKIFKNRLRHKLAFKEEISLIDYLKSF